MSMTARSDWSYLNGLGLRYNHKSLANCVFVTEKRQPIET